MPLTFAHPAAVLPARWLPRTWYSWTALIVGSVIPDFEAFIKLGGLKQFSHSWWGMFAFDLPLGLAVVLLFHAVVKDPLVNHLPRYYADRFHEVEPVHWRSQLLQRLPVLLLCLLIGCTTHLLWDRFTHTDTYTYHQKVGLELNPEQETEARVILQWLSSIAGIVLICWQIHILPRSTFVRQKYWRYYWYNVAGVAGLLLFIRTRFYYWGDDLINTAIAGVLLGVILSSLVEQRKRRKLSR